MLRTCWVLLPLVWAKCPVIIGRSQWNAMPSKGQTRLIKNLPFVVIHHTADPKTCNTPIKCQENVKNIQKLHQNTNNWKDIGYNFLIGNDGNVYEGRGWLFWGSHAPMYNSRSIGISFIGNFNDVEVPTKMVKAAKLLIECGIEGGYIASTYKLFGHRQVNATECPGENLYKEIQSWTHYSGCLTNTRDCPRL